MAETREWMCVSKLASFANVEPTLTSHDCRILLGMSRIVRHIAIQIDSYNQNGGGMVFMSDLGYTMHTFVVGQVVLDSVGWELVPFTLVVNFQDCPFSFNVTTSLHSVHFESSTRYSRIIDWTTVTFSPGFRGNEIVFTNLLTCGWGIAELNQDHHYLNSFGTITVADRRARDAILEGRRVANNVFSVLSDEFYGGENYLYADPGDFELGLDVPEIEDDCDGVLSINPNYIGTNVDLSNAYALYLQMSATINDYIYRRGLDDMPIMSCRRMVPWPCINTDLHYDVSYNPSRTHFVYGDTPWLYCEGIGYRDMFRKTVEGYYDSEPTSVNSDPLSVSTDDEQSPVASVASEVNVQPEWTDDLTDLDVGSGDEFDEEEEFDSDEDALAEGVIEDMRSGG